MPAVFPSSDPFGATFSHGEKGCSSPLPSLGEGLGVRVDRRIYTGVNLWTSIIPQKRRMFMNTAISYAREMDAQDPLASFRDRFIITDPDLI